MKRSKPTVLSKISPPSPPEARQSRAGLRALQRQMAEMLFRPLTPGYNSPSLAADGRKTRAVAAEFIKPNDRLTSFERLQIYHRQYWYRILDCFYEDYPGLRGALGEAKFGRLAQAYLARLPSRSYTLRNLGSRLEKFLRDEPVWTKPHTALALDIARFEWAQVVAFDGEAKPVLTPDDLLDRDPAQLRLGLQPYLTLLAPDFPVDDFVLAVKKREALRGAASNAVDEAPKAARLEKVPRPKPERICVAVHRCANALYYKRLEPAAYEILTRLAKGATVARACAAALKLAPDAASFAAQVQEWFAAWTALGWFYTRDNK